MVLCYLKQKALEFSFWLLKKALPSREEPDISLSIVNSEACSRVLCIILARSAVACSIHVAMILYVGILNV